jgi:hypothetical protein
MRLVGTIMKEEGKTKNTKVIKERGGQLEQQ